MLLSTVEQVPLNTSDAITSALLEIPSRRVDFYAASPVGFDGRLREAGSRKVAARGADAALASSTRAIATRPFDVQLCTQRLSHRIDNHHAVFPSGHASETSLVIGATGTFA
jgi:hypothetical protein